MRTEVATTLYFREQVLRKRPYIRMEMCLAVLHEHYRSEVQPDGRIRFWGYPPELNVSRYELLLWKTGERCTRRFRMRGTEEVFMKLHYYMDTDSLYIDLSTSASVDSREISDGFVVDYDAQGNVTGLDIQHASQHLDLSRIETTHLPLPVAV